jgi:protein O-mannosyl-transferase
MKSIERPVLASIIIFFLVLLVFGNTLFHKFCYDDHKVIVENTFIISPRNIPGLFSSEYFSRNPEKSYRPVVTASYFSDHFLFSKSPAGYHFINLLIHALVSVSVYFFLGTFIKNRKAQLFSALLFALNPLTCEAVNCISFREDLLAGLFVMSAWCVAFAGKRISFPRALLSSVFILLAFFSKESAVPLIMMFFLFLYLNKERYIFTQEQSKKIFIKNTEVFSVLMISCFIFYFIIRFFVMKPENIEITRVLGGSSGIARFYAPFFFLKAWKLFIFPVFLNADYVFHHINSFFTYQAISGWIFAIFYISLCIVQYRAGNKKVFFALLWVLLFFLPASNLVPLTNSFAERYLYLPLMGFVILPGLGLELLFRSGNNKMFRKINYSMIIIILVIAYLSIQRNLVWGTDKTLWTSTLEREPDSVRALNGVALVLIGEDNPEKAGELLEKAMKIDPRDYKTANNLAIAYLRTGHRDNALLLLKFAVKRKPDYAAAHYNLSRCYFYHQGQLLDKAKKHLDLALKFGYPVPASFIDKVEKSIKTK